MVAAVEIQQDDISQRHGGYFPHIGDLRCLAIASVVVYHAQLPLPYGGFGDVGLFFVISGLLITRGLGRELRDGRVRLSVFYFYRIRRLIPALLPMLIFVLLAGTLIYYPVDLKPLAAGMIAALLFSANILFYTKSGYSAEAISDLLKPMAHLQDIPYADPLLTYCADDKRPANRGALPLFYDYRHVSNFGVALFAHEAARLFTAGKIKHELLQKRR